MYWKMPAELRKVAEELEENGYRIRRCLADAVIIEMDDGEVHFVPDDGCIKRVVLAK